MPSPIHRRFKVFLVSFPDTPAPAGFDAGFIRALLFGEDNPGRAPLPDGSLIGTTVSQYFASVSDGRLKVTGDVADWVQAPFSDAFAPHWSGGMKDPASTAEQVYFGESWPVAVAMALRQNGFVSANYKSPEALRKAILALPDGSQADMLVFLYCGLGADGVRRDFEHVESVLKAMSLPNVTTRLMPDGKPWETLWDPAWKGLPGLLCSHILSPRQPVPANPDGTLKAPDKPISNLKMTALSWVFHEFGHLAADMPDVYGENYSPWGVWDLMGGPAALTHFPMTFSAFLRHQAGWLRYSDRGLEDHRIRLKGLETHNFAVRLPNGPPGSGHFLILENRDDLNYATAPPRSQGRCLLLYRADERGRLRVPVHGGTVRKITQIIDGVPGVPFGSAWKAGMTPGETPAQIHSMPGTCRNALGELWWTIDEIADGGDGDLAVKTRLRALSLLDDFHRAVWQGESPGQNPVPLALDFRGGSSGHVVLQESPLPVQGETPERALFLQTPRAAHSAVRGRYRISDPGPGGCRLHAVLAMPDDTSGSDGVEVRLQSGPTAYAIPLQPGQAKPVCLDFPAPGGYLEVVIEGRPTSGRDRVYILDGWLVPLAPALYDFIAQAPSASWGNESGPITFGAPGSPAGEASLQGPMGMHTGILHGPQALFTHPQWKENGFIRGTYPPVPVPAGGAILRALIGFQGGRTVTDNGATVSIEISVDGNAIPLIEKADVSLWPAGSGDPMQYNDLTVLELPLPPSAWGKSAAFTVRVDAAGSSAQDWVSWPYFVLSRS